MADWEDGGRGRIGSKSGRHALQASVRRAKQRPGANIEWRRIAAFLQVSPGHLRLEVHPCPGPLVQEQARPARESGGSGSAGPAGVPPGGARTAYPAPELPVAQTHRRALCECRYTCAQQLQEGEAFYCFRCVHSQQDREVICDCISCCFRETASATCQQAKRRGHAHQAPRNSDT